VITMTKDKTQLSELRQLMVSSRQNLRALQTIIKSHLKHQQQQEKEMAALRRRWTS